MIYLIELPSDEVFQQLSVRYPELNVDDLRLCVDLVTTTVGMVLEFEEFFASNGLSQSKFLLLTILNRNPGKSYTPTELAEMLRVSRATMTGLLDSLEDSGFVDRNVHSLDRRKMTVRLTAHGLETLDRIMPLYYAKISETVSDLGTGEKTNLRKGLQSIQKTLTDSDNDTKTPCVGNSVCLHRIG